MTTRRPSKPQQELPSRREAIALLALAPLAVRATDAIAADAEAIERLRAGSVVVLMRHALAPGVFDPPGFRLDDCSTQRNLSDEGRAQAQRIGAWFRERGLLPARVRTSPWCRCIDTAELAFGRHEIWPLLGSTVRDAERARRQTTALREALTAQLASRTTGFDVCVTHQVVITGLTGAYADSGDAVVLRRGTGSTIELAATLRFAV